MATANPYLTPKPKELWIAFLLWAFTGFFGGHRFYLNRTGTAIAQVIFTLTLVGIVVTLVWNIVDIFLMSGMVREENEKLAWEHDHPGEKWTPPNQWPTGPYAKEQP